MLQRLGKYDIQEIIGSGGQGTVYRARDTRLDRDVALKVMNGSVSGDSEYAEILETEARLAARLNHPNITVVHDFNIEEDIAFIVMELVPNSLESRLRDKSPLPYSEAVRIAVQVAKALSHAHDNKVLHRDLKPGNILITNEGIAKVSDFGLARAAQTSSRWSQSSPAGTYAYMAPEQWSNSGSIGPQADIYSLGITLYQMLSGTLPFEGTGPIELYNKHLSESVPGLPEELGIPDDVENAVRKALEKDPRSRFFRAREMVSALSHAIDPSRAVVPEHDIKWAAGVAFEDGLTRIKDLEYLRAIDRFTAAIRISPEFSDAFLSRGHCSRALGDFERAISDYTEAIRLRPDSSEAFYSRGIEHRESFNDVPTAIEDFTAAIELEPQSAKAYNERGLCFAQLDEGVKGPNHRKAIQDYTEAIHLMPDYADSYHNRGVRYAVVGEHQMAISDFTEVLSIRPDDRFTRLNRGLSFRALGMEDEAREDLRFAEGS